YRDAKLRLFTERLPASLAQRGSAVAVIRTDEVHGITMRSAVPDDVDVLEWGLLPGAGIRPRRVEMSVGGIALELDTPQGPLPLYSGLLGRLNVENLVGSAATALALGLAPEAIATGLASAEQVPGRLELVAPPGDNVGRPVAVVDYAHTPEAVAKAAASLAEVTPGRLTVVLGCGGDRDPTKRAPMGAAAVKHADGGVVLTSDNPRSEDPEAIIADILPGVQDAAAPLGREHVRNSDWEPLHAEALPWWLSRVSRRQAVAAALGLAGVGDLVLIAGKGHETTQEIDGVRTPMSDHEEVRLALAHRSGRCVVETLSPEEMAQACGAQIVGTAQSRWRDGNAGVTSDSRTVEPGMVFVAIVGQRLDGHDFLNQAVERGASLLLVEGESGLERAIQAWRQGGVDGLTLVAEDTVKAMGDIAQHVLAVIRAVKPWFTTVAITGSNGKTTTKELIRTLCTDGWLALERRRVHATPGNFNNFIGVPLTLFALRWGHDVAVLEVGTSAFGEIRRLVEIVQPDVRVLTSVSTAHLDGLGDEAGVLRAKGELFEGMKPADVALMEASLWERLTEANLLDDAGRCGLFGLPAAIADARASGGFEGMSVTAQRSEEEGALALACVDEGSDPSAPHPRASSLQTVRL
ncbi:MAG: Mur ligase family protein, partial [Myxococcota bacterium]